MHNICCGEFILFLKIFMWHLRGIFIFGEVFLSDTFEFIWKYMGMWLFKFYNSTKINPQNILIVGFVSAHFHQFLSIKKVNGERFCLGLVFVFTLYLNYCIDDWFDRGRGTYFQLDNKWAGNTGTDELLPVGQEKRSGFNGTENQYSWSSFLNERSFPGKRDALAPPGGKIVIL